MADPLPDRIDALWFALRASAHRLRRRAVEIGRRPPRHRPGTTLAAAPVVGEFASRLWPADEAETRLVAGKIHNLRLARRHFDGLEIPAGATFSFWRQLGRAQATAGYVPGRELREGCLVPAVGGGLCQLSNALYNVALRAGFEVVERHRHSRILPGSLAEQDRDATVFWNYRDLRLRAPMAWRLEVEMDALELRVRLRASSPGNAPLPLAVHRTGTRIGDCASCDRSGCHRHTGPGAVTPATTWLFDPDWPEAAAAFAQAGPDARRVVGATHGDSTFARALDAARDRLARWRGVPRVGVALAARARKARRYAAGLRPDDLHLVVALDLLPTLWRDGALAGRRFDVLLDSLPMAEIQRRLDAAARQHPQAASLRDFRAPAELVAAETAALAAADRWLSAHAEVLALAGPRAVALRWQAPPPPPRLPQPGPLRLLFPASSLARKGALELRDALRGLPVRLLLPPGASETAGFWDGIEVEAVPAPGAGLAGADAVVLPAWVEHQPRALLAAIAAGLPVIATPACGLPPSPAWIPVPAGDVAGLRAALVALATRFSPAAAARRK